MSDTLTTDVPAPRAEIVAAPQIAVAQIEVETMVVPIRSTAPIIINRFSEKAKLQMLQSMQGIKVPKASKDPAAEYEASRYRTDNDADGFPVIGFKAATVSGARLYGKGVTMTQLRQAIFMDAPLSKRAGNIQLVTLHGTPHMREDVVRVGNGGTDLRYRAEIPEWTADLVVTYAKNTLTRDSVLGLIQAGGMSCGIGEWRPEKRGNSGTYQLDLDRGLVINPDPALLGERGLV